VLDDRQRRALYFRMARRVLETLVGAPGIDRVAVVTASDEVAAFATGLGARVIQLDVDAGTVQAYSAALEALRPMRLDRLLMMAGDLPLLSREALRPVLAASSATPGVVIVPDHRGIGTNALLCSPPDAIPLCFGQDSLRQHLAAARARGIQPVVIHSDPIGLDLDVPEDLDRLRVHFGAPRDEGVAGLCDRLQGGPLGVTAAAVSAEA
jgi:2-phospho-L-lactate guanylyltransferase